MNSSIRRNNMSLCEFLNANCEYVSKEEQKDIDELNIDYSEKDTEEMTLNELLQE